MGILAASLAAALLTIAILYPLATRPLSRPGDKPLIEQARRDAEAAFGGGTAAGPKTFPIVIRLLGRTCVELRSLRGDGAGSYVACYESRTGAKLEERASIGF